MSSATTAKTSAAVPWLFFVTNMSNIIGTTVAGTYLVFYITERMLISSSVMGIILLLSRIVDLIVGLFAGIIIQKTQMKWGQYRTWLFIGPLTVAIGTTMCFINPQISITVKTAIVFVGYLFYGGGMSFIQLSQNGMMSKVAGPDMKTRIGIAAKLVQGQSAGMLIASFITLPLILFFEAKGVDGYSLIQVIFASVGFIGQLCLFIGTKNYDVYDPKFNSAAAGSVKITTMFKEVLSNGQIIIVILADAVRFAAFMGLAGLGAYYFTYVIGDISKFTISMAISSCLGLVTSFLAPKIAQRIGKKPSALLASVTGCIGYLAIAFFCNGNLAIYIACASFVAIGGASINAVGVNLYLDCAEYQLYKTGQDTKTFSMSMFGIAIKIGIALSSIIVSFVLSAGGYEANNVADPEKLGFYIGFIPGVLMAMYGVIILLYRITDQKAKEYAEANHAAAMKKGQAA